MIAQDKIKTLLKRSDFSKVNDEGISHSIIISPRGVDKNTYFPTEFCFLPNNCIPTINSVIVGIDNQNQVKTGLKLTWIGGFWDNFQKYINEVSD